MRRAFPVALLLTTLLTCISFYFLCLFIGVFYHPDIASLIEDVKSVTYLSPNNFRPAPTERLFYEIGLGYFALAGGYIFLKIYRWTKTKNVSATGIIEGLLVALVVVWTIFAFLQRDPLRPGNNWFSYFHNNFIYDFFWIFSLLVFPFFFAIFLCLSRLKPWGLLFTARICEVVIVAATLAYMFFANIFPSPYSAASMCLDYLYASFSAVIFPISQVLHGRPMLIDHFTSNYGLYAQMLKPLFTIVEPTVLNITGLMAFMVAVSFLLIYLVLAHLVKSRTLRILGFTTIFFVCYLNIKIDVWDYVFQYFPIRTLFPSLFLLLAVIYAKRHTTSVYYLITFIFPVAFLWNPETGIVITLSWLLMLLYIDVSEIESWATDKWALIISLFAHVTKITIAFAIEGFIYSLLIFLTYKQFPDFSLQFRSMGFYFFYGYGKVPMPVIHPWNLVMFVYLGAYFFSLLFLSRQLKGGVSAVLPPILFLLSVMGVLLFTYYQGRGDNWTLPSGAVPAMILLTVSRIKSIRSGMKRRLGMKIIFATLFYVLSFSIFDYVYNWHNLEDLLIQRNQYASIEDRRGDLDLLQNNTHEGEGVLIFSHVYQGILHLQSKTYSIFTPGFVDPMLKSDVERLREIIRTSSPKIFFDKVSQPWDLPRDLYDDINRLCKKVGENRSLIFVKCLPQFG